MDAKVVGDLHQSQPNKRQESVIGGWAESSSSQPFKTLLFERQACTSVFPAAALAKIGLKNNKALFDL